MNVASKKNITSIIGIISMRPLRRARDLRNFIVDRLSIESDMIDHPSAEALHLVHHLRLPIREIVEREEGDECDEQPDGGRDQGFGDTTRNAARIDKTLISEELERADHARDRAEKAEQRGGGDDRLEDPQPPAKRFFDEARLVGRARFDPPGRTMPIPNDNLEKGAIVIALIHRVELVFKLIPGKAVSLDKLDRTRNEAGSRGEEECFLEHDNRRQYSERQERINHYNADLEGGEDALWIGHAWSPLSVRKPSSKG